MAEIRNLNSYNKIAGFNITNADPIDSRTYVNDISHIYKNENWTKVKPYPGLIVSDPNGNVRICINSDYTKETSWKRIGDNNASGITEGILSIDRLTTGTTNAYGITKLYSGTDSTAENLAATPKAIKTVYDKSQSAYNLALNAVPKEEYDSDQEGVAAALNNVATTTVQGIDGLTGSGLIGDGNITISHYIPERATGTTGNVTLNGFTTFQIPSYGFDTYGHVTGATGITYSLPIASTAQTGLMSSLYVSNIGKLMSSYDSASTVYLLGSNVSGTGISLGYKSSIYMSGNTIHGAIGYYQDSDERLKTFHGDVEVDFEKLLKLPKAYFTWNNGNENMQMGTSAQKVRELYPELVSEDDNGKLSVDYSKLSVIALKGLDILYSEIQMIKKHLNL